MSHVSWQKEQMKWSYLYCQSTTKKEGSPKARSWPDLTAKISPCMASPRFSTGRQGNECFGSSPWVLHCSISSSSHTASTNNIWRTILGLKYGLKMSWICPFQPWLSAWRHTFIVSGNSVTKTYRARAIDLVITCPMKKLILYLSTQFTTSSF